MWGTFLSEPLRIVGLVGRYPANYLMRRMPIRDRVTPLTFSRCLKMVSCRISRNFSRLFVCHGQVAYVLLTRAPVAGRSKQAYSPAAPRLACVKPVASVHPEPGSNSSLLLFCFLSFKKKGFGIIPLTTSSACADVETFYPRLGSNLCFSESTESFLAPVLLRLLQIFQCSSFILPSGVSTEKLCKVTANF